MFDAMNGSSFSADSEGFSTFVIIRRVMIMLEEDLAAKDGGFTVTFSTIYPLVWYRGSLRKDLSFVHI